jgi:hypothetical protein
MMIVKIEVFFFAPVIIFGKNDIFCELLWSSNFVFRLINHWAAYHFINLI